MASSTYSPVTTPQIEELLDTLNHPLRRATIQYFEHRESSEATLDEIIDYITALQFAGSRDEVTLQLTHMHLPKLADREWIEYSHETREIRYYGHETADQLLNEVNAIF